MWKIRKFSLQLGLELMTTRMTDFIVVAGAGQPAFDPSTLTSAIENFQPKPGQSNLPGTQLITSKQSEPFDCFESMNE